MNKTKKYYLHHTFIIAMNLFELHPIKVQSNNLMLNQLRLSRCYLKN
jgi:hypothetical protein